MPRLRLFIAGTVQGVGFRPFVHREAEALGLTGWVQNDGDGVRIEVEGARERLAAFVARLERTPPEGAELHTLVVDELPENATKQAFFVIREGTTAGPLAPVLPADRRPCAACLAEVHDPASRRFRYPFTSCASCGPRLSIALGLPWSRERTTLAPFPLCAECAREYAEPRDRRFHAESMACPRCGPTLRTVEANGAERAEADEALTRAVAVLRAGGIVAVKGLGGFQLLVDATDEAAVARLRMRKHREEKPFALLVADLSGARALAALTSTEERALVSAEGPIVLATRASGLAARAIAPSVAPTSPRLGLMLPATPLHALLAEGAARPLVCTSGNLSEEPMATTLGAALARLGAVADLFLDHDRAIARPVDDSVVRHAGARPIVLRRARGLAPRPLPMETPRAALAFGAHLKATVTLAFGGHALTTAHLGDLGTLEAAEVHRLAAADLCDFFRVRPEVLACDLHPDFTSTRDAEVLAERLGVPLVRVQHHHAHIAAGMAEHGLSGPVLGLAWDGLGLGTDGTLWGGEALSVDETGFARVGHLGPFRLPGGEGALRDPRRVALGLLHAADPALARRHALPLFDGVEGESLMRLLATGHHAPVTTSVGRLFDAVAALTGLNKRSTFEGQAAMAVEDAADAPDAAPYPVELGGEPAVMALGPFVEGLVADLRAGRTPGHVASRLHATLFALARGLAARAGLARVVLGGGVFQNAILLNGTLAALGADGFETYAPRVMPPGDGAISLGQAWVATRGSAAR